jgi:hemolysin activation/secretion protein
MMARPRIQLALWLALCALAVPALPAHAQGIRPSEQPLEVPAFPEAEQDPSVLPPIPAPPVEDRDQLSSGVKVFVREIQVLGSTVFTDADFAPLTEPYTGREISTGELGQVRNAVTRLYVDAGYITSGAVIPDQDLAGGVVVLEVVEGRLEDIDVEGTDNLQRAYVRDRIALGASAPLNVFELEKRLQLLAQKPLIRRIDASLNPGLRRGESTLSVLVEEGRALRVGFGGANSQSNTVGSYAGRVRTTHLSLTGEGDVFTTRGEGSEGYRDLDTSYSIPLNARDTTLSLHFRRTTGEVIEDPFDDLDVESVSQTFGMSLRHPVIQDLGQELWIGLTGEYRTSKTDYKYGSFPFIPGSDDGRIEISVLRLLGEWTRRSSSRVLAARSTVSFGLDLFGSTTNRSSLPDSRYVAWLAQVQAIQRLPAWTRGSQLVFRTDLQLTNDPLLSLEQFSLGGMNTVRGYAENQLVRDNGIASSVELRVPLLRDVLGPDTLQFAPFFDIGQAWNERHNSGPETLASLGVGFRYQANDRLRAELYWGGRLRQVSRSGHGMANHGFHFDVEVLAW